MEEYMPVALVTSAYSMLATTSLIGMGNGVTKETFDWIFSEPKIVRSSAIICRLMDDMVFHKFEQKRGHVASVVECYMKHDAVPMPILMRVVNLARVIDVIYKYEYGYTPSGTIL
ncbi:(-)-germacrene D synthase [Vitis vinifera]|uniref:(-)-germacrene D synthase n=1 Tax=Vitis vinifera TaxID=29760 RepID=A0A438FHN1_VITVI|nr:(-)-germacrene D synthase [Vitis vinifera]